MPITNYKQEVLNYLKKYETDDVVFTKKDIEDQLTIRRLTKEEIVKNLLNPKRLVFAEKQEREFKGDKDVRYNCYFLFSKSRAHRYVLSFNDKLKVITAIPLGRKTLNKMSVKEVLEGLK